MNYYRVTRELLESSWKVIRELLESYWCNLTLGREVLEPELCVVMVSTVVMPRATRAGAASMLIQKDTQDRMTISRLGMYI